MGSEKLSGVSVDQMENLVENMMWFGGTFTRDGGLPQKMNMELMLRSNWNLNLSAA